MATIRTVGHGASGAEEFEALVKDAGITCVVDVRRYPGSRKHPWFGRDQLERWLPDAGIEYRLIDELGGRRRPDPASPNTAWRNAQFAAYADHMASDEFARGIEQLLEIAEVDEVAIMCSESLWWRCHRRLVADHLVLVEQRSVEHLFHDGRADRHEPMAEAVLVEGRVEYPDAPSAGGEVSRTQ